MDPTNEILFELPTVLRIYADGRLERFPVTDHAAPGLDGSTLTASKDVDIDPEAPIRVRIYLPGSTSKPDAKKFPVLVYYHGGGFISGSTSETQTHGFLNELAARAQILIVSVDYRLAPENPMPVFYDDSLAAFKWAVSGSDEWISEHGDLTRVFLAGESAGANIAHQVALRVGDQGKINGLALVHPLFWGSERMESEKNPHPDNVLQPDQLDYGWQLVCGPHQEADLDDPRLNPLAEGAPPLGGLVCEKVLVCVAGRDLIRDRGRAYHDRLKECGWKGTAEILESEGEDHGFYFEKPEGDKALELMDRLVGFFGGQ